MNLDELDFKIIEELKKDSRLSMRELGQQDQSLRSVCDREGEAA